MRFFKFALPALVLSGGLFVSSVNTHAKPAYATKEKKTCTFCHTKAGAKDLNEAGTYYKEHNHSLEGYKK